MDAIFNPFYAHLTLIEQKRYTVLRMKLTSWIMHVEQQRKEKLPIDEGLDLSND